MKLKTIMAPGTKKSGGRPCGTYIGGKAGFYIDTDDFAISANAGGKISVLIGIEADLEVTLSAKPIIDGIKNLIDRFSPSVIEGTLISGCPNILIG